MTSIDTSTRIPVSARRGRRERSLRARAAPFVLLRAGVLALLAGLAAFAVVAALTDYPLRVTSDSPTFIALVADMASEPFAAQSPLLDEPGIATQHATPYTQALAFAWQLAGGDAPAPVEIGRMLAFTGIGVFAFALFSVFLYTRKLAGRTAAWVSVPVLLGLFGPAHVIWASDLTLHGALYAGFYPQNLAIALALLTLLALERASLLPTALAVFGVAATFTVHPFTGALLAVLVTALSVQRARARDFGYLYGPLALLGGYALGSAWPAYSLARALGETGVRGSVLVTVCAAVPVLLRYLPLPWPARAVSRLGDVLASRWVAFPFALVGVVAVVGLGIWQLRLIEGASALASPRLAIYWNDDRWRWALMLGVGAVGLVGLVRLARRGHVVPLVWLAGCFAVGLAGALGLPLPVWYRFLLLCQIPLALGVAVVVADAGRGLTSRVVGATFATSIGIKVVTLLAVAPTITYFGTQLPEAWSLGRFVPPGPGLVATDPQTAYYIPATTGRRVLTVSKGHVSSDYELALSAEGYALLRRYYAGGSDWWEAGQEMWRRGVRYVVIEKHTTLEPRTLADFTWRPAQLRTPAQRRALGTYYYANNRVGTIVHDSADYVVYRLEPAKLFVGDSATR